MTNTTDTEKLENMNEAYVLTVLPTNASKRGVFARCDGAIPAKPRPWTDGDILEMFGWTGLFLFPKCEKMSRDEIDKLCVFYPLSAFNDEWGIAYPKDGVEVTT